MTRNAACDYIKAAAFCSDDDPERANYLSIALTNMCHSGHVSIRDIKDIYDLLFKGIESSKTLFGDDPEDAIHSKDATKVGKFVTKLDVLVKGGKATLESRLKPIPDVDVQKDSRIEDMAPAFFAEDEDEAGWRTPDGKFVENNPIFLKAGEEEVKDSGGG